MLTEFEIAPNLVLRLSIQRIVTARAIDSAIVRLPVPSRLFVARESVMNEGSSATMPLLAGMMFAAGLGIPVFAALNAGLGRQLGGPVAATSITFAVGLAISLALLAFTGVPGRAMFTFERPQIWLGAVFMLFYAISIAFAAPRLGLANAIFFVLLGQIVAAATIDHFGWLDAVQSSLTARRMLGIVIMAAGIYLARRPV
jgi:transporter family-2 protein